jgi:hypothetical protein
VLPAVLFCPFYVVTPTREHSWRGNAARRQSDQAMMSAGWLMLVEDAPGSSSPVRDSPPHFEVFPDLKSASYLERYNILCRKFTQERLYTRATVMPSPRAADSKPSHDGDAPVWRNQKPQDRVRLQHRADVASAASRGRLCDGG